MKRAAAPDAADLLAPAVREGAAALGAVLRPALARLLKLPTEGRAAGRARSRETTSR